MPIILLCTFCLIHTNDFEEITRRRDPVMWISFIC